MNEHDSHKVRWSILLFAAVLTLGSLGLAGCPDDDDDDDIFRVTASSVGGQE